MSYFFLLLEVFLYGFGLFIFWKKRELGVIYLPVLFFSFSVITPVLPVPVFYGYITLLLLFIIKKQYAIFQENPFSVILFIYFLILLTQASATIKLGLVYSVMFFFIAIPLIAQIYKEYSRNIVFKELTKSAIIILLIFIINVLAATVTKYSETMYGISSGILYGNLKATNFNLIGVALFIVLFNILKRNNFYVIGIYVVAIATIMLTLRRSAMLVSALGIPFVLISTLNQREAKKVVYFAAFAVVIGGIIYFNTDFASVFQERYEIRNLDERELEEEKRFFEYDILYKDMFVYKDYSPWFGFELFNSAGNYGKGIFEDRTLHSDIASIAHSSGLVGVFLYFMMIATAFYKTSKLIVTRSDLYIVLYCFIVFAIYTITGRYTQVDAMVLLFLLVNLNLAKRDVEEEVDDKGTEVDALQSVKFNVKQKV